MAKRRGKGEGTVYPDRQRGVWVAQLPADELTGKRPQRTAPTQREALALLAQMKAERQGGKDLTAKQPTVAAFLDTWLEEIVKPTLRASTHDSYRNLVRLYIVPTLGRLRIEALTPALCQRWANQLTQRVAISTVHNAYQRLRTALNVAIDWGYITSNPAKSVKLSKLPPVKARGFTVAQARQLLDGAAGWHLEALVWVLLVLGLRRGEVLGLAWRDLDWKAGTITITQQVQAIAGKRVVSPTPKTDNARRTLPLPPGVLARLRHHWTEQLELRALLGADWHEHGLIFPVETNGRPMLPRNLGAAFTRLCTRVGVPVLRIHDCRHTCAGLLGDQGESSMVIGAVLGHAPASITDRYAHVSMDTIRAALTRLERTLEDKDEIRKEGAR
jgi:integrase